MCDASARRVRHERVLLESVFPPGETTIPIQDFVSRSRSGKFISAIRGESQAAGLIDESRAGARLRLLVAGGIGLAAGLALLAIGVSSGKSLALSYLAATAMVLGGAVVVAGLLSLILVRMQPVWSDSGLVAAAGLVPGVPNPGWLGRDRVGGLHGLRFPCIQRRWNQCRVWGIRRRRERRGLTPALPDSPKAHILAATQVVVVGDKILADEREIDDTGVGARFDEVQVVSNGGRFSGEITGIDRIFCSAMPNGLTLEFHLARSFRGLNADAIVSVDPVSEPGVERRGGIERDRPNVF